MATAPAPVKSQPLHNFSLSFLKWSTGNSSASRGAQQENEHVEHSDSIRPLRVGSRSARSHSRFVACSSSSGLLNRKAVKPDSSSEFGTERKEVGVSCKDEGVEGGGREAKEGKEEQVDDEGEAVQRPWNLRPRKLVSTRALLNEKEKTGNGNGQSGELLVRSNPQPKSLRLRGMAPVTAADDIGGGGNGVDKRKFWVALSREEIEEDFFAMTGNKPSKRPKKRPKSVQKQIEMGFPGMWLIGTSADDYREADAPAAKK